MRRRNVPCSPCGSGSSDCGCCPPKSIKKINNIEPDDNGKFEVRAGTNVTITDITNGIEISSAGSVEDVVKTVNGVSPDADGEVTITAGSNITITPDAGTNSIEISASGGSLSAEAPLEIVNDTIKLKGWTLYTSTNWSGFVSEGITTEDIYIVCNADNAIGETFVPKGTTISANTPRFDAIAYDTSGTPTLRVCIAPLSQLVGSYHQVAFSGLRIDVSTVASSSGTINESITIGSNSLTFNVNKRTALDNNKGIRLFTRS